MTEVSGVTTAQIDQAGDDYAHLLEQALDRVTRTVARRWSPTSTEDDLGAIRTLWQEQVDELLAPTLALLLHTGAAGVRGEVRDALTASAATPAEPFHLAGKHNQKLHNPRHRAQAKAEAGRLIGSAAKNEPGITSDLERLAGDHGAELIGLDHRLKTEASLERKIGADMVAARPDTTARQVSDKIGDTVRYTAAFPPDQYAGGTQAMQGALAARGYTQVKHKNTWSPDSPYRGINQQWDSPDGQRFELQFHTPTSFELKNGLQHKLYEEYRLPKTTPARRQQLDVEMKAAARALPMPPGALGVGPVGLSAGAFAGPERLERPGPFRGDLDQVVVGLAGEEAVPAVGVPAAVGREALDDPLGGGAEE
jgi:hypothetical protein